MAYQTYAYTEPEKLAERGLIIGYVARRAADGPDGTWVFLGTTPEQVGKSLAEELDAYQGLSVYERDELLIEARIYTLNEIENMPDFPGW